MDSANLQTPGRKLDTSPNVAENTFSTHIWAHWCILGPIGRNIFRHPTDRFWSHICTANSYGSTVVRCFPALRHQLLPDPDSIFDLVTFYYRRGAMPHKFSSHFSSPAVAKPTTCEKQRFRHGKFAKTKAAIAALGRTHLPDPGPKIRGVPKCRRKHIPRPYLGPLVHFGAGRTQHFPTPDRPILVAYLYCKQPWQHFSPLFSGPKTPVTARPRFDP